MVRKVALYLVCKIIDVTVQSSSVPFGRYMVLSGKI